MKPTGLTLKTDGEIVIIHQCLSCNKISRNRIAGDDSTDAITQLLNKSSFSEKDTQKILTALFGKNIKNK